MQISVQANVPPSRFFSLVKTPFLSVGNFGSDENVAAIGAQMRVEGLERTSRFCASVSFARATEIAANA